MAAEMATWGPQSSIDECSLTLTIAAVKVSSELLTASCCFSCATRIRILRGSAVEQAQAAVQQAQAAVQQAHAAVTQTSTSSRSASTSITCVTRIRISSSAASVNCGPPSGRYLAGIYLRNSQQGSLCTCGPSSRSLASSEDASSMTFFFSAALSCASASSLN